MKEFCYQLLLQAVTVILKTLGGHGGQVQAGANHVLTCRSWQDRKG